MPTSKEIILLNISGPDKPGITTALTHILSQYKVLILDIGQAVIHDELALGMLIEVPPSPESAPILKDLLFRAYELGVNAKFTPVSPGNYEHWVKLQGKERYIITLIARVIHSNHVARVAEIIHKQNLNIDIAFQEDNIYRRNRRLVCFDMDSTLIRAEMIVELARMAGVGDKVNEITEGASKLITTLKKYGYKTAILSGGFTFFGRVLQHELGIDYAFGNELEIAGGKLTGNYVGDIVDGQKKAELMKNLAGLGIAFHAKPKVKENARQAISTIGLDAILYLMGFRDRELK